MSRSGIRQAGEYAMFGNRVERLRRLYDELVGRASGKPTTLLLIASVVAAVAVPGSVYSKAPQQRRTEAQPRHSVTATNVATVSPIEASREKTLSFSGTVAATSAGSLAVTSEVPRSAIKMLKPGQTVVITSEQFPGRGFLGSVVSVEATPAGGELKVAVPNEEHVLAPGMKAQVQASVSRLNRTFLIPTSAVVRTATGGRVLVLGSDNKVQTKVIQLGDEIGDEVEVTSGLTGNESIIDEPQKADAPNTVGRTRPVGVRS